MTDWSSVANFAVAGPALTFLLLRAAGVPEQPWPKWLIPVGIVVMVAAVGLELVALFVVSLLATALLGIWDWYWRMGNGSDVFW